MAMSSWKFHRSTSYTCRQQELKFVLLSFRVYFLGHGHAGRCGEEPNAGGRSAAEEVQGDLTLHHPQLQDGGSAGERLLRPETLMLAKHVNYKHRDGRHFQKVKL